MQIEVAALERGLEGSYADDGGDWQHTVYCQRAANHSNAMQYSHASLPTTADMSWRYGR